MCMRLLYNVYMYSTNIYIVNTLCSFIPSLIPRPIQARLKYWSTSAFFERSWERGYLIPRLSFTQVSLLAFCKWWKLGVCESGKLPCESLTVFPLFSLLRVGHLLLGVKLGELWFTAPSTSSTGREVEACWATAVWRVCMQRGTGEGKWGKWKMKTFTVLFYPAPRAPTI